MTSRIAIAWLTTTSSNCITDSVRIQRAIIIALAGHTASITAVWQIDITSRIVTTKSVTLPGWGVTGPFGFKWCAVWKCWTRPTSSAIDMTNWCHIGAAWRVWTWCLTASCIRVTDHSLRTIISTYTGSTISIIASWSRCYRTLWARGAYWLAIPICAFDIRDLKWTIFILLTWGTLSIGAECQRGHRTLLGRLAWNWHAFRIYTGHIRTSRGTLAIWGTTCTNSFLNTNRQ